MPLSSYIFPVVTSGALMAFCFILGRMGFSILWIGIFIGLNFLKTKFWKQRQKQVIALQTVAKLEKEIVLAELNRLSDLPAWVQFPDTERAEWINKMILQLWPYISEFTKKFLKENIEPIVRQNLPSPFRSFRFESMDMGDIPVRVTGIKVYTANVGRDRIVMDMDVAYAGDCEFVVGVGAFRGGMNNLQFKGKLRCTMKPLVATPPLIGGVSAYFLDNPTIDFNLTGLGEMVELPGLMTAIRSVVVGQVANICVLPNEIVVPLMPNIDPVQLHFPQPDGVIRIHLIAARNLENRDLGLLKGKSDPYVRVSVGAQMFESKTIDDNLNPTWNEYFEAVVDQANGQRVIIEVYDEDPGSKDEFLGRATIDIEMIRKKGSVDQWYALEGAKHGDIHIKVFWLGLSEDVKALEKQQWDIQWLKADARLHSAILMVYVDSASQIPSPKSDLEPSPLMKLTIGHDTRSTYTKHKTTHPVYQEKFIFLVDHPENQTLKVEAKQDLTDRSLGEVTFPIKRLLDEPHMELHQRAFPLVLGAHQSPLIMTLRLRTLLSADPKAVQQNLQQAAAVLSSTSPVANGQEIANDMHNASGDASGLLRAFKSPAIEKNGQTVRISRTGSLMGNLVTKRYSVKRRSVSEMAVGRLGSIQITVQYSYQRNRLVTTVHQAENLAPLNSSDTASPYAKVTLFHGPTKKLSKKTAVHHGTLNPQWEDTFDFDVHFDDLAHYSIRYKVCDGLNYGLFARSKKTLMGQIQYALAKFDKDTGLTEWFDLGPCGHDEATVSSRRF